MWRLERYVREESVIAGLASFIQLAEEKNDAEVRQILLRMRQGLNALGRGARPVSRWLSALSASLKEIGVHAGLPADSAGSRLLVDDVFVGLGP